MSVEGHLVVIATDSHLKTALGWSLLDTGISNALGGVRLAAVSTIGRLPTVSLSYKTARIAEK